jgi:hypothetical protein
LLEPARQQLAALFEDGVGRGGDMGVDRFRSRSRSRCSALVSTLSTRPAATRGRLRAALIAGKISVSGFIACYVGGLLLSGLGEHPKEELLGGACCP